MGVTLIRIVLAVGISALLCQSASAASLRLDGRLGGSLTPQLELRLQPKNPLCFSARPKLVAASLKRGNGQYELEADWKAGFCRFVRGEALLRVDGSSGSAIIDFAIAHPEQGSTELHEISRLECAMDPDFGEFACMIIRPDDSLVVGQDLFIDPGRIATEAHLDIVSELRR